VGEKEADEDDILQLGSKKREGNRKRQGAGDMRR